MGLPNSSACVIISFGFSFLVWGISAAGSAPHWQCGGHGFESRMLHFEYYKEIPSVFIIVLRGAVFLFYKKVCLWNKSPPWDRSATERNDTI